MSYLRGPNLTCTNNSQVRQHHVSSQPFTNWPKTCEYGALREDLIRDHLIVGISDAKLPEKRQMIADLTLEKAITLIRQSELVHDQQDTLRGNSASADVTEIKARPTPQRQHNASSSEKAQSKQP